MSYTAEFEIVVVPEFDAPDLGVPFKVALYDSVRQVIDKKSGEVVKTVIPNLRGLLEKIAVSRIVNPRKLSGEEIKFIRRSVGITASKLSEKIGVTPEHFSRCESGERVLSSGAEKCLRISILLDHFELPKIKDCVEVNESLRSKIELFQKTLLNVQSIINEMRIVAANDVEDELVLGFRIHSEASPDLFDEDADVDWQDQPSAMAA